MASRDATGDLIMSKFIADDKVYIQSRESYFRFFVHTENMFDNLLAIKMQNGTDEPKDFERAEKFKKLLKQKSYQEYLEHKTTDEAKKHLGKYKDGILKFLVDDHDE